jgi:protocatechuate 3,4-dioxygenase beta subunit
MFTSGSRIILMAGLLLLLSACSGLSTETEQSDQNAAGSGLDATPLLSTEQALTTQEIPDTGIGAGSDTASPTLPQDATPESASQTGEPDKLPQLSCSPPAQPTPGLTEGPYYKDGSPRRPSLYDEGMRGQLLVLTGYVLTTDCQPVANAWLDFWQANANGMYDNAGYILRGHQYTDENGYYELTTVVPGIYSGRTEHIHFKVQAPGGEVITSQLFFPNSDNNQQDGIFDPALLVLVTSDEAGMMQASFNIIVP